jgi:hypothetical protein
LTTLGYLHQIKVGFAHVIKTSNKLHLLNKKASVSSDILVGHVTSSQNESGLSKYLMVHE